MAINPDRYGIITNEFRYDEELDSLLEARYVKARELTIDTNFKLANINNLLTDMFGVVGDVRRRFSVEFKGTDILSIDDFSGQVPCFYFTAPEFGITALPVIVTSASIDEGSNSTTIEVWG